ncbi:hypothetical protein CLV59_101560 [Chitinophaga dinghuensis]|uniref:Uncharacterized protein n=1 Tax=Chitinophaga dinghuensis TaxID=1539050 RepID=A0A327WC66_9BACT|nr:hypothetical protein [Chitinophaga dinghuensis]RAJ87799.1 hypothetical protein CLV59_101560 [Chitinophaga dinghuensis]
MLNYYTEVHKIDALLKEGLDEEMIITRSAMAANEVQMTIQTIQAYEDAHPDWNTYPKSNKVMNFVEGKYGWILADVLALFFLPLFFILGPLGAPLFQASKEHNVAKKDAPIITKAKYLDAFADQLQAANLGMK